MIPGQDFQQPVIASPDAMLVSDVHGAITLWSQACERIPNFTSEEAIGRSLDLIYPERLRRRHGDGYQNSMATGSACYGTKLPEVPAVNKVGEDISVAFTVATLRDTEGKVTGVLAILSDETKRFAEECAMKRRIAELELQFAGCERRAQPIRAAPQNEPVSTFLERIKGTREGSP